MLGRDAPAFLQVRLKFVFFNVLLIVIAVMESIMPSSTHLSANNRTVQREYPSGGLLQHNAMMCASTSTVTFGATGGVALFFL